MKKTFKSFLKLILFAALFNNTLFSQQGLEYFLTGDINYSSNIPTPQSYFGFIPGEYHLRYDQIIGYIKLLAQNTDRMKIEEYGKTYEQRSLYLLTISSPVNLKNIEEIRAKHKLLSDPQKSSALKIEEMPVVVWLGYSVHGNEASGANSVPLLLYHLTAATGKEFEEMLSKTIIIVDPVLNPDGLDRFAIWTNMHRSKVPNTDPFNREHQEYWPNGRGNHYWFDLNRDWLLLQHPESRSRVVKYHEWMPNILTDHHEMGSNSTFFFQPGVPDRANPLTPKENYLLTKKIAQYHAKSLDKIGALYFSEEVFDDFYYGKGSSYPDINGSIGILFEQASSRGIRQENNDGVITFPFAIRNQFITSLSTLTAAYDMRVELLNYQKNFFVSELKEAQKSDVKAYIFGNKNDQVLNNYFVDILNRHQIDVYELNKNLTVGNVKFEAGSAYVVPTEQPNFGLITTLFKTSTEFKDSIFYDISSWTFPLAFNLPYAEYKSKSFPKELIGKRITALEFPKGSFEESDNVYAYLFSWDRYLAPKVLNQILNCGIKVKAATKPFKAATNKGEIDFNYGSIIIPFGIQRTNIASINNILKKAAEENNIDIYSLSTGLSLEGIDIGSSNFVVVNKPKVMLIVGPQISSIDAGEIWHLLDQRMEMSLSLIETRFIRNIDLKNYTTIIMTDGSYSSIDSSEVAKLKQWIQEGGTLISIGSATEWLINKKFTKVKLIDKNADKDKSLLGRREYALKRKDQDALAIPGSIFQANLDLTHPLGFGYTDPKLYVFVSGNIILQSSSDPYSTPLQYSDKPLVSGFVSKRILKLFENSASIVTDRLGKGNIIMITEGPNYRAYWYSTNKLLMNSIFFGRMIN